MDSLNADRQLIQTVLLEHTKVPYAHGEIKCVPVFDRERDHYLLMIEGWDKKKRIHGCLVHVDLINDKFWIQRDGTEEGIATELEDAGIPKDRIVLAFHSPGSRQYTEYAVA